MSIRDQLFVLDLSGELADEPTRYEYEYGTSSEKASALSRKRRMLGWQTRYNMVPDEGSRT
eukprot:scaffold634765_cov13-Prasinocladus_malaysianus.AAC.1